VERCAELAELVAIDVASLMSIASLEELAELQDTSVAKIHPVRQTPSKTQLHARPTVETFQLERLTCIRFFVFLLLSRYILVSIAPPQYPFYAGNVSHPTVTLSQTRICLSF